MQSTPKSANPSQTGGQRTNDTSPDNPDSTSAQGQRKPDQNQEQQRKGGRQQDDSTQKQQNKNEGGSCGCGGNMSSSPQDE